MSKFRRQRVLHGDESEGEESASGSDQSFVPEDEDRPDLSDEEEPVVVAPEESQLQQSQTSSTQKAGTGSPQLQKSPDEGVGGRSRGNAATSASVAPAPAPAPARGGRRGRRGGREKHNARGGFRNDQGDPTSSSKIPPVSATSAPTTTPHPPTTITTVDGTTAPVSTDQSSAPLGMGQPGKRQFQNERRNRNRRNRPESALPVSTVDGTIDHQSRKPSRKERRDRRERRTAVPSKILARNPQPDTTAAPADSTIPGEQLAPSESVQVHPQDSMTTAATTATTTTATAPTATVAWESIPVSAQGGRGPRGSWADEDGEMPRRRRERTRKPRPARGTAETGQGQHTNPTFGSDITTQETSLAVASAVTTSISSYNNTEGKLSRKPEAEKADRKSGKRRLVKMYVPKVDHLETGPVFAQPIVTTPATNDLSTGNGTLPTTATATAPTAPTINTTTTAPVVASSTTPPIVATTAIEDSLAQQQGKAPRHPQHDKAVRYHSSSRSRGRGRDRRDQYLGPDSVRSAQHDQPRNQTVASTVQTAPSPATTPKKLLRYSERHRELISSTESAKTPTADAAPAAVEPRANGPPPTNFSSQPRTANFEEIGVRSSDSSDSRPYYDFFVPTLVHSGAPTSGMMTSPPHMQAYQNISPAPAFGPQMQLHMPLVSQPQSIPGISPPFFGVNQGLPLPTTYNYHQQPPQPSQQQQQQQQPFLRPKLNANARIYVPGMNFGPNMDPAPALYSPTPMNAIHPLPNKPLPILNPTTGQPIDLPRPAKPSSPVIPAALDRENVPILS